jgi:hypothetical protein
MMTYAWTFMDDYYSWKTRNPLEPYAICMDMGVEGFITEFP